MWQTLWDSELIMNYCLHYELRVWMCFFESLENKDHPTETDTDVRKFIMNKLNWHHLIINRNRYILNFHITWLFAAEIFTCRWNICRIGNKVKTKLSFHVYLFRMAAFLFCFLDHKHVLHALRHICSIYRACERQDTSYRYWSNTIN